MTLRTILAGMLVTVLFLPASAQPRRWVPNPAKSVVTFDATHQMGDFSGRAEAVTGEFQADTADLRASITGVARVRVAVLRTGNDNRDRDMRKVLDVDRFPEIRFTIGGVEPSFNSVTSSADTLITIKGGLAVRGVERPVTFLARVRLRDDRIWVRGESRIRLTDFGIKPPSRLFFRVGDDVTIGFDLTLEPSE
ncbi:MAG TPA: YceI family protein [Verrucomicrobiae bacterium]|nr:YceI family protein [Verrucomicrobiae bacterium]